MLRQEKSLEHVGQSALGSRVGETGLKRSARKTENVMSVFPSSGPQSTAHVLGRGSPNPGLLLVLDASKRTSLKN